MRKRIAIAGGAKTGKSTLAKKLGEKGRKVHATDDLMEKGWSEASEAASHWFDEDEFVVEGVAVPRALRKWLARHPDGKPCDTLLLLEHERVPLEKPGQRAMNKGVKTVLEDILPELKKRGVEIVTSPSDLLFEEAL